MADYRNQHFVPRMYLRLFNGGDEHMIDIVPTRTGRVVRGASLRDQASRPWFYGRDGSVERLLGTIEGQGAAIIAGMLRRDRPPARLSAEHQGLAMFISLQHSRTAAAAADANERADKVAKSMIRQATPDHELLSRLELVRVSLTNPVADAMRMGFLGAPLLYDLRMKIIVNTSGRPFLVSDAPVILHNRLHEGTGAPAEGYANSGLQVMLPLGPWRALLLYDEDAYDVGSSASQMVRLVNPAHADVINDLQWESARNVMFVPAEADDKLLREAWKRWRTRRRDRVSVEQVVLHEDATSKRTRLIVGSMSSEVKLALPFVRVRVGRPAPWSGEAHAALRHAEWARYVTDLCREVDAGRLHPATYIQRTLKVPRAPRRR